MSDQPPADHVGFSYESTDCSGQPVDDRPVTFSDAVALGAGSWHDSDTGQCWPTGN